MPELATAGDLPIAGVQSWSSVDWPGKFSAVIFVQGCPWRCWYCHNHAIIDPTVPGQVRFVEVLELLRRRRGLLDGVVFSGGEATRCAELHPAMAQVRELGFGVGLHTAGAYPRRLGGLLQAGLVDWVGIDVKAPLLLYPSIVGRPNSGQRAFEALQLTLDYAATHPYFDYEVRLTALPNHTQAARSVALECRRLGVRSFALQQVRQEGAPRAFQVDKPSWDVEFANLCQWVSTLGFEELRVR